MSGKTSYGINNGRAFISGFNSAGIVHNDNQGYLSSSKIVAGDISANAITTDKIADGTITAIKIAGNNVALNNTAFGLQSLEKNMGGYNNTAIGVKSLNSNTTGLNNTSIGFLALEKNTVGQNNTANGFITLQNNTTGSNNTANGFISLINNITGSANTAIGFCALEKNITGSANTAIGFLAGNNNKNSNNTFLGSLSDLDSSANAWTNSTAIGYNSKITASNQIVLGTSTDTVNIPKMSNIGFVKTDASGNLTTTTSLESSVMPTSAPANQTQPPAGTFWFDVLNKKLKISDGSDWYDLTLTPST